jgi:alanyl-tRNA synthetase
VRFDQTVFYPQGGGQPSDQGEVRNGASFARVAKVTHAENGDVDHLITGESDLASFLFPGAQVTMVVDEALRRWHSRLHSAGHVVDAALARLAITLTPTKGYHYEDGAYVEYDGTIEGDKADITKRIENSCKEIIAENHQVFIDFSDESDDRKCLRSMRIGNIVAIPCGGTHVAKLKEIGNMTIRKVEIKKGKTRVCYAVEK